MKFNLYLVILFLAGLFQIIALSFDQLIIQQESSIYKKQNEIVLLEDELKEIITSNLSFGRYLENTILDQKNLLYVDTSPVEKKLLKIEDNIYNIDKILKLILSNKYINLKKTYKDYSKSNKVNELLKSKDVNLSKYNVLTHRYGEVLEDLYNSYFTKKEILIKSSRDLKKTEKNRLFFLVLGMLSNVVSIIFLLIFFYFNLNNLLRKV